MPSDAQRDEMRKTQDQWLADPTVRHHIPAWGWNEPIATRDSPTFADVRDTLLPDWQDWFRTFLDQSRRT